MRPTLLTAALAPRRWGRRVAGRHARAATSYPGAPFRWDGLPPASAPRRQVDPTTCGAAVLVALRAGVDPAHRTTVDTGFGAAQRAVARRARSWWPRALGTTPWGLAAWLRTAGIGTPTVRLVDAADRADLAAALAEVDGALAAGWPVPLLVGCLVPRHWCLALPGPDRPVYEPSSGEVRAVPAAAVLGRRLRPLLGFDDLQAAVLPVSGTGGPRRDGRPSRRAVP